MAGDKQNKQETASKKNQQEMGSKKNQKQSIQKSSLTRLTQIPLVEFSIYLSISAYNRVKSSTEIVNNVLNKAEKLVTSTIDTIKPVIFNRLGNQVEYVDSLANKGLDKLETTVPSVFQFNPKTIYANTVNRLITWRSYANDKLNVVRSFSLRNTTSGAIKKIDNLVDTWIPGSENEEKINVNQDENLIGQVSNVFGKLRRRGIEKVSNIQRLI